MTVPADHDGTAREVDRLLRLVAARGLPGARPLVSPDDDRTAERLVWGAVSARLTGPLLAAHDAGEVALPPEAAALLVDRHHQALVWCLELERRLLDVGEWFDAAGIPFVVLKGPAAAHLDLLDPSERTFADLDLLVAGSHTDRAVATLEAHGLTRRWAEVRPGWDRRFAKSVTLVLPSAVEVDLHRTLCDGVFGARIPLDRLHAATEPLEVGGRRFRALGPTQRVLNAAYHAVVGSTHPRLSNLREIALHLTSGPPLEAVVDEARRWRGEAVLAAAVELTASRLDVDAPAWSAWAAGLRVGEADARAVAHLRDGDAGLARHRFDLVRELRGTRDKAAYLWGVAFPSSTHLATSGRSVAGRYRRWLPVLLRRPAGPGPTASPAGPGPTAAILDRPTHPSDDRRGGPP